MKTNFSVSALLFAMCLSGLAQAQQATHGQDETVPSNVWPNTRYFEAIESGVSNRLFIGGRDAAAPIMWGAYPDDNSATAQYRYMYSSAPSARILFANWANGSYNIDFSDDATINQGDLITWKNRFNLQKDGKMNLTGSLCVLDNSNTSIANFTVDNSGNLWARQVKVTVGTIPIPDYVFTKNYSLMSLSQLEKYIEANKHLPNIPSAEEIACNDNTVNLAEMQMKLLEKVEELTLYVIELNKKNAQLEAEVNRLKKLNAPH